MEGSARKSCRTLRPSSTVSIETRTGTSTWPKLLVLLQADPVEGWVRRMAVVPKGIARVGKGTAVLRRIGLAEKAIAHARMETVRVPMVTALEVKGTAPARMEIGLAAKVIVRVPTETGPVPKESVLRAARDREL